MPRKSFLSRVSSLFLVQDGYFYSNETTEFLQTVIYLDRSGADLKPKSTCYWYTQYCGTFLPHSGTSRPCSRMRRVDQNRISITYYRLSGNIGRVAIR